MTKRILYFCVLVALSWMVMTTVHEMGHLVGGWIGGATLQSADLRPWRLPYSLFQPDPYPLITMWCGPLLGVVIPMGIAMCVRCDWMWFIAYFCVVANGAYLALSWISGDRYLDALRLLEHGAHPITLAIYCVVTLVVGYLGFRRSCLTIFSRSLTGNEKKEADASRQN